MIFAVFDPLIVDRR